MKRKLVALILLPYRCIVTVNVLLLFLRVPGVGVQCVIEVFPDQTHNSNFAVHIPFKVHKAVFCLMEMLITGNLSELC